MTILPYAIYFWIAFSVLLIILSWYLICKLAEEGNFFDENGDAINETSDGN